MMVFAQQADCILSLLPNEFLIATPLCKEPFKQRALGKPACTHTHTHAICFTNFNRLKNPVSFLTECLFLIHYNCIPGQIGQPQVFTGYLTDPSQDLASILQSGSWALTPLWLFCEQRVSRCRNTWGQERNVKRGTLICVISFPTYV